MKVTATLSSGSSFTDLMDVPENQLNSNFGQVLLIVSGIVDSTVTVQCSVDGGTTWYDLKDLTADTVEDVFLPSMNASVRVGIKSGNYGTDSVDVILNK